MIKYNLSSKKYKTFQTYAQELNILKIKGFETKCLLYS